jgi:hypothetical protein
MAIVLLDRESVGGDAADRFLDDRALPQGQAPKGRVGVLLTDEPTGEDNPFVRAPEASVPFLMLSAHAREQLMAQVSMRGHLYIPDRSLDHLVLDDLIQLVAGNVGH